MKGALRPSERVIGAIGAILLGLALVTVLAPAVMTVVLSLSNDSSITFPPKTWGFDRYLSLFTSSKWLSALWLSVRLSLASALVALLVGGATLIALLRSRLPFRGALEQASLIPMVLPVSAYAVAMFVVYTQFRIRGSEFGIIAMNAVLAIPMVILITGASLRQVPTDLELVANTLGASRFRALFGVTVPVIAPALLTSFAAAFQTGFEEAVFIDFLGGPGLSTLPKSISDSVRYGSDPVITAIAASLILITTFVVAIPLGLKRGAHDD